MADLTTKSVLSVYATVESNLANLAVKDGQLIFVRDKHKIALDFDNKRTVYHQIQELATEGARTSLLAPISGAYYFVLDPGVLWKYQDGWIQITTPPSEVIGPSEVEQMVNSIVQEKIDNGELGNSGSISATDDGNGNVTLNVVGFSVIDDGNGNITIS